MSKKKSAKKKPAKKAANKSGGSRRGVQSGLRIQLTRVLKRAGKVARQYHQRFKYRADHEPTMEDWPAIKTELQEFEERTDRILRKYHAVRKQIDSSGDSELVAWDQQVDALGFGQLLRDMNLSLAERTREALAPLDDEDRRQFWEHIRNLNIKASVLSTLADAIVSEIESPGPNVTTEGAETISSLCMTLGNFVRAGIAFAEKTRHDDNNTRLSRMTRAKEALDEYEVAVDDARIQLQQHIKALEGQGGHELHGQVRVFAERIRREITFDAAICDHVIDVMSNAIYLPKEADAAAVQLRSVVRQVQAKQAALLAECSAAEGENDGRGDRADPEKIRGYEQLNASEKVVVDFFRTLAHEQGTLAKISTPNIIEGVSSTLRSLCLAGSGGTIRGILQKLTDENILLHDDGKQARVRGHGGALSYRLTVAATAKFPRWDAAAVEPHDALGEGPTAGRP